MLVDRRQIANFEARFRYKIEPPSRALEWLAEAFRQPLRREAAAYLDADDAGGGGNRGESAALYSSKTCLALSPRNTISCTILSLPAIS